MTGRRYILATRSSARAGDRRRVRQPLPTASARSTTRGPARIAIFETAGADHPTPVNVRYRCSCDWRQPTRSMAANCRTMPLMVTNRKDRSAYATWNEPSCSRGVRSCASASPSSGLRARLTVHSHPPHNWTRASHRPSSGLGFWKRSRNKISWRAPIRRIETATVFLDALPSSTALSADLAGRRDNSVSRTRTRKRYSSILALATAGTRLSGAIVRRHKPNVRPARTATVPAMTDLRSRTKCSVI